MSNLINQTAARKMARSLHIRLGSTGIAALNARIEEIIREASDKARKSHRKTILERDVRYEHDLFS